MFCFLRFLISASVNKAKAFNFLVKVYDLKESSFVYVQAVKLLLECRQVRRNEVNGEGLTFLDILRNQGQRTDEDSRNQRQNTESDLEQTIRKTGCKTASSVSTYKTTSDFLKSPITFWPQLFTFTRPIRSRTPNEARGVFLIICTLLITSTYQTALQPPGGLHQSDGAGKAGTVVMKQVFFITLWVFNTLGFCCALFYTFCLIPLDDLFQLWFSWIGASLCVSYALAMAVISPHPLLFLSATFAFFLFFLFFVMGDFVRNCKVYRKLGSQPQLKWFWRTQL